MSKADAVEEVTEEADAAILEESRRVLDHQIEGIHTVEDRAAWMLRIGVILLGALVSAIRLFGVPYLHELVFAGFASLVLSLVVGILTYGVSAVDVGVEPATLYDDVPNDYERSDVYDAVVAGHEESIRFNRLTLRANELLLTLTQVLLAVGASLVATGLLASI